MIETMVKDYATERGIGRYHFQQDGASAHINLESINEVRKVFKDKGRLISINGDQEWPPRSPDLTPLDFWLWFYLKSKVYVNNLTDLDQLKQNINKEIRLINEDPALIRTTL